MFDRISPTYDLLNRALSLTLDRRWRRLAAAECPVEGRVLDLCCGTADQALAIADLGRVRLIGADFSFRMLRRGAEKINGHPIRLVQADALNLPFARDTFDGCAVSFGVRNMADAARGLREIRRILKPGGKAVLLEFAYPEAPPLRRLYDLYLGRLLPAVGDAVSRSHAYRYLSDSVGQWHRPGPFCDLISSCGFAGVRARPLTFGVACIYLGTK
jgi:demethylmenaquinone methyltransferase/2-methoxy-6-polyprenyl-1,4-benzoquinol methylase